MSEFGGVEYAGREISAVTMDEERLCLSFGDGTKIAIWDNGQDCCEHRYMTTDDDVQSLVGGKLRHIELKPGPTVEEGWEEHETCFVEIATDKGFITLTNHNEHNGYYGGFSLAISEET